MYLPALPHDLPALETGGSDEAALRLHSSGEEREGEVREGEGREGEGREGEEREGERG